MLKAMVDISDAQIYNRLVKGYFKNRQIGDQVEVILLDGEKYALYSQNQCLAYIGSRFRTVLDGVLQDMSDVEVGRFLIERLILVHVPDFNDKFQTLILMIEKLYAVVAGECECDSLDSVSN
jgi:DNA-directed RNA polymerase I subunit RPA2